MQSQYLLLIITVLPFVIVLYFVVRYFMSILLLQSSGWGRESWLLCLVCLPGVPDCCVALPHGAMGLCAVCDCDISGSYSLFLGVNPVNRNGSGESALVSEPKPRMLAQMPVLYYLCEHRWNAMASLHICLVWFEPLSQFKILMWWLKWRLVPFCASSKDFGESAHLHRLTLTFDTVQILFGFLKWLFVCYSRQ